MVKSDRETGNDQGCTEQLSPLSMFNFVGSFQNSRNNRKCAEILPLARREKWWRKEICPFQLEKIKMSRMKRGLHIRDLKFQNLAMGAKILWNLIETKPSWSSQVLIHKYFSGSRLRCLDSEPVVKQGSPIFSLYKKALLLVQIISPLDSW